MISCTPCSLTRTVSTPEWSDVAGLSPATLSKPQLTGLSRLLSRSWPRPCSCVSSTSAGDSCSSGRDSIDWAGWTDMSRGALRGLAMSRTRRLLAWIGLVIVLDAPSSFAQQAADLQRQLQELK